LFRYAKKCVPFQESVEVTHEFVRIECQANGTEIYKDYHGFIPKLKEVPSHVNHSTDSSQVNVVIIGLDSLSRLNMIRKMPKTYEYLTETLNAFPMYGYNKVGLNTFPNLIPLLTGYSSEELSFCWGNYTAKFDLCPFIWKAFNYRGYATSFIEDTAWMGLFLYLKYGFVHQPTQYDPRPIFYSGEKEAGHNKGLNANYCIGSRFQIQMVVEYTHKLMRRLRYFGQRHFTLSWGTSFSHDYINEPQLADKYYFDLLQQTYQEGLLNDTILIFMSDHGLRFGSFLNTEQGQLEGLLPSLYFVIPEWFQERYPRAMRNFVVNQRRLMTAFDLHQTLNDLMDLRSMDPEYLETREKILKTTDAKGLRGISLFLPVPEDRDCGAAGVPEEFCACRNLEKIDIKSPILEKIVLYAIGEINARLHSFPDCVPLVYKELKSALHGEPIQKAHRKNGAVEYKVTFHTDPGEGLFSASLLHYPQDESLEIIGDISRLNAYGNQSHCVPDFKMRPLCFCVSQLAR